MGAVLGAVSPAVVIPRMVQLMENSYGTQKHHPSDDYGGCILRRYFRHRSVHDICAHGAGGSAKASDFLCRFRFRSGSALCWEPLQAMCWRGFEAAYARAHCVRNSMKVILVLGLSFLLMAVACMFRYRAKCCAWRRFRRACLKKFGKLWLAAEVVLFVLVGAAVDIRYTASAGANAL